MSLQSDHKALLFVGAIALLGGGVRIARATWPASAPSQPALERQMQAADSARKAAGTKKRPRRKEPPREPPPADPQASQPIGRLDLDVATATQIDSLPGVGPSLAKKIAADRMAHGPFLSLSGLRRVKGVTPRVLVRIDTLVRFSGTIVSANPNDSVITRVSSSSGRRSSRARGPTRSSPRSTP